MNRLICLLKGHHFQVVYDDTPTVYKCSRCGKAIGYENLSRYIR